MSTLRRHWPLALVLPAGAALRAIVIAGYNPLFFFTDTARYLKYAKLGQPDGLRPWGYSGFLRVALHFLSERGVVILQHAVMLGYAALLYAFLVRRGARPWVAALAVVPLCLSPLLVNIEHHLLSDWLFVVLVVAAAVLLAWSDERPALWACALAGLAFGAAIVTRQVALPLALALAVYLLVRRAGAARLAAFVVPLAAPVVAYVLWFHSFYGVYGFSTWNGKLLYSRVAPIAQCEQMGRLTAQERQLCDPRPLSQRPGTDGYLWTGGKGPARHLPDKVVMSFARKVIIHQPVAYAELVARETAEVFYPGRRQRRREGCVAYWEYPNPLPAGCRTDAVGKKLWRRHPFKVNRRLADVMSLYQHLDALAGPVLLACLLTVGVALVRRRPGGRPRLRLDALLFAVLGLGVIVLTLASVAFSYRYTMPLYATLPIGAALAATYLTREVKG